MLEGVIDVPYWTQLASDTMYSLEQVLESKIVGDKPKDNSEVQIKVENSESWVSTIKDQAIYHVSLAYNLANHDCQTQPWWTDLSEKHIVLGALPFHDRKHVERLKKLGVGGVLTLNKPFELEPNLIGTPVQPCDWLLNDVESLHIPTPDFCPPTCEEIKLGIEFMKKIINSGKSVYVHCKAGRGRSVVAVVCYLMEVDNMSVEAAIDYVKQRRPQINMGKIQQNICLTYYNQLHGIKDDQKISRESTIEEWKQMINEEEALPNDPDDEVEMSDRCCKTERINENDDDDDAFILV